MKSIIIAILLLNILHLPNRAVSFTARPPLATSCVTRAATPRPSTHLHGILDRLRKKEDTANDDVPTEETISPEMTEMALTTKPEEYIIPEEEEELTQTQKLLKQVKEAGTAGGEFRNIVHISVSFLTSSLTNTLNCIIILSQLHYVLLYCIANSYLLCYLGVGILGRYVKCALIC